MSASVMVWWTDRKGRQTSTKVKYVDLDSFKARKKQDGAYAGAFYWAELSTLNKRKNY